MTNALYAPCGVMLRGVLLGSYGIAKALSGRLSSRLLGHHLR